MTTLSRTFPVTVNKGTMIAAIPSPYAMNSAAEPPTEPTIPAPRPAKTPRKMGKQQLSETVP